MNGQNQAQGFHSSFEAYFQAPSTSSPSNHLASHTGSPVSLAHMGISPPSYAFDAMRPSSSGGSNLHVNISGLSVNGAESEFQQQAGLDHMFDQNMMQNQHKFMPQRNNSMPHAQSSRLQNDLMLGGGAAASSPHSAGASPHSENPGLGLPDTPSVRGKSSRGSPSMAAMQGSVMLGAGAGPRTQVKNEDVPSMGAPSRSFSTQSIKSAAGSAAGDNPVSTFGRSGLQGGPDTSTDDPSVGGQTEAEMAAEKRQSSKFVYKLFRMVSDPDYQHLISWNRNGTSVMVCNFDEFAKEVLGKHFKHSNFSSFIRQLNMYGFYKVNKTPRGHRQSVDTQIWEFSHPKFLRGRPDLLDDIRRKALDSEHARVEARDLQYSVSVSQLQLRQQFEEMQYRIDDLTEQNMALRTFTIQLRDVLGLVLEHIKKTNGGHVPFDVRIPTLDMPSPMPPAGAWTPQMHDGPPIFVTEPEFGGAHRSPGISGPAGGMFGPQDPFSMSAPVSRRVSQSSNHSGEGMMHMQDPRNPMGGDMMHPGPSGQAASFSESQMPPPHMGLSRSMGTNKPVLAGLAIDTSAASAMFHGHQGTSPTSAGGLTVSNAGLGVMSMPASPMTPQHQAMFAAINTPLPPSPVPNGGHFGPFDGSPFMQSNGFVFHPQADESMMGPNAKAMRTPLKRTASNSGPSQQGTPVLMQTPSSPGLMKRKSPV